MRYLAGRLLSHRQECFRAPAEAALYLVVRDILVHALPPALLALLGDDPWVNLGCLGGGKDAAAIADLQRGEMFLDDQMCDLHVGRWPQGHKPFI